jgi:hypothetical protein
MRHMCIIEYCSAINKNEVLFVAAQIELKDIMLSEII